MNGITDLDNTLQVLASHNRRWILYAMRHQEIETVDELIPVLRNLREAVSNEPVDKTRITIQLQHSHLPKLVDSGFIDYDPQSGSIALTERFDAIRDWLKSVENWEKPTVQANL